MAVTETVGIDKNGIEITERIDTKHGTTYVLYPFSHDPNPRRGWITVQNKRFGVPSKMGVARIIVEARELTTDQAELFSKALVKAIGLAKDLDDANKQRGQEDDNAP